MHRWKDKGECLGMETNLFFDKYEEDPHMAKAADHICNRCPVQPICFASGVSNKEWGVWGGIYLTDGKISKEFNAHKTKDDWFNTWESLTMETE
jgi:hypothetical protein